MSVNDIPPIGRSGLVDTASVTATEAASATAPSDALTPVEAPTLSATDPVNRAGGIDDISIVDHVRAATSTGAAPKTDSIAQVIDALSASTITLESALALLVEQAMTESSLLSGAESAVIREYIEALLIDDPYLSALTRQLQRAVT